jgi:hypothetical protein
MCNLFKNRIFYVFETICRSEQNCFLFNFFFSFPVGFERYSVFFSLFNRKYLDPILFTFILIRRKQTTCNVERKYKERKKKSSSFKRKEKRRILFFAYILICLSAPRIWKHYTSIPKHCQHINISAMRYFQYK